MKGCELMQIVTMLNQHRRDFRAIVECEGCGAQREIQGYDDRLYHDNVLPAMECPLCGKPRNARGLRLHAGPQKARGGISLPFPTPHRITLSA